MTDINKLKEKLARIEDYGVESRLKRIKSPLSDKVPFGKENRTPTQIREDSLDRAIAEGEASMFNKKILPPKKPTQADRKRIISAKMRQARNKINLIKNAIEEKNIAIEHKHSIIFKGHNLGNFKSASLENQSGKYAKYWLLNAKQTNGNGWGIASHTAKENMKKFIGRPLVVTSSLWHGASEYGESFEHPYLPTNDMNTIFNHQERFRVGNIVDVYEDGAGDWYASIEMLPKFASKNLPPFCSPAIYQLDAREHEGSISKWEALHLAALTENPAYGARIALLKGTCIGTKDACRVQFKGAKLTKEAPSFESRRDELGPPKTSTQAEENARFQYMEYGTKIRPKLKKRIAGLNKTKKIFPPQEEDEDRTDEIREERERQFKIDVDRHIMRGQIICPKKLKERLAALTGRDLEEQERLDNEFFKRNAPIRNTVETRNFFRKEKLSPTREERLNKITDDINLSGVNLNSLRPKKKPSNSDYTRNIRRNEEFRDIFGVAGQDSHDAYGGILSRFNKKGVIPNFVKHRQTQDLEGLRRGTPSKLDPRRSEESLDRRTIRNLRRRVASLGEQNMTYQNSKRIKILKKKYPEVRKAQNNVEDILRSKGRSVDASHSPSSWLSQKGDFIGSEESHIQQIIGLRGSEQIGDKEKQITDFSASNGIPRVQKFDVNRAGEKKISVGVHSKINSNQLKSIRDLEKGGNILGFAVGADHKTATTGEGFSELMKALRENKFL